MWKNWWKTWYFGWIRSSESKLWNLKALQRGSLHRQICAKHSHRHHQRIRIQEFCRHRSLKGFLHRGGCHWHVVSTLRSHISSHILRYAYVPEVCQGGEITLVASAWRASTKPYQNTRVGDLELRNFLFRSWSLNTVPNHGGLQLNWVTIWLRSTSRLHPLGRIACLNFELIRNQLSSDKHALLINLLSFGSYLCRFTFLMKYSCTAWVDALGGWM